MIQSGRRPRPEKSCSDDPAFVIRSFFDVIESSRRRPNSWPRRVRRSRSNRPAPATPSSVGCILADLQSGRRCTSKAPGRLTFRSSFSPVKLDQPHGGAAGQVGAWRTPRLAKAPGRGARSPSHPPTRCRDGRRERWRLTAGSGEARNPRLRQMKRRRGRAVASRRACGYGTSLRSRKRRQRPARWLDFRACSSPGQWDEGVVVGAP